MEISDEMIQAAVRAYTDQCGGFYAAGRKPMAAALTAALALQGWRTIDSAPKDGTRILIWFVHANAAYSKDPIKEGWAAAHEAHWIDHNGGGWTWYGLCGVATLWQPLPAPPAPAGKEDDNA